jgi:hypothetical protein
MSGYGLFFFYGLLVPIHGGAMGEERFGEMRKPQK